MRAPLSPLQQQFLSASSPTAAALDLGTRVGLAETLQWAGRIATAHVRLVANPIDGDTVTLTLGPGVRRGAPSAPGYAVCEFDTDGSVTSGRVAVTIGATPAATAAALARVLVVAFGGLLTATAHPLDVGVVDLACTTPAASLSVTTSAPARIVVQANDEQQDDQPRVLYMLLRTVTAEDIARTRIRVDTGLHALTNLLTTIYNSGADSTSKPWNGTVTLTGGVLEFTIGTAAGALTPGNILQLLVLGSP